MEGKDRPVTFAMNGGPGASSVYLNLGAIGPKRVAFGDEGDSPSDPATLTDNPGTWLDFTDLVFIDPIGTGYSRSLVSEAETKKLFYSTVPDIQYLSRIVYDWLVKNGRLELAQVLRRRELRRLSRPAHHALSADAAWRRAERRRSGLAVSEPDRRRQRRSLAASLDDDAAFHRRGAPGAREQADARRPWLRSSPTRAGDYATALLKGRSDPAATQQMIQHVTELTGLDPRLREACRRPPRDAGLSARGLSRRRKARQPLRSERHCVRPFPNDPDQRSNDPILASIIAPTTTAMVNFVTQTVGWKIDARYNALSGDVNRQWDGGDELRKGSVEQLREAVATDPKLHVLIVHGWNDLSCPFMGSVLTVDQMPVMGDPTRVQVKEYPGGHMFYSRPSSQMALRKDVMEMFRQALIQRLWRRREARAARSGSRR